MCDTSEARGHRRNRRFNRLRLPGEGAEASTHPACQSRILKPAVWLQAFEAAADAKPMPLSFRSLSSRLASLAEYLQPAAC